MPSSQPTAEADRRSDRTSSEPPKLKTILKTPPKQATNPLQFVKVGPCSLYRSAQEQLQKVQEVKKIKQEIRDDPEDWQSNLDNWKSSRRKRQEHIIERVVEVKKLELEEHDRNRRRSKTFSEMMEERESRGRKLSISLAIYNEDDANDLSDLGIGTSSGKSSISGDTHDDSHSVLSDRDSEIDKNHSDVDGSHHENGNGQDNGNDKSNGHATSKPDNLNNGFANKSPKSTGNGRHNHNDTLHHHLRHNNQHQHQDYDSATTATASSPEPEEYTYEGAIRGYVSRVAQNIPRGSIAGLDAKLDNQAKSNGTSRKSPSTSPEKQLPSNLPKVDISKRREIFEKVTKNGEAQNNANNNNNRLEFTSTKSIKERLSCLERKKSSSNDNDKAKDAPLKEKHHFPEELESVRPLKERLSSFEKLAAPNNNHYINNNHNNNDNNNVSVCKKLTPMIIDAIKEQEMSTSSERSSSPDSEYRGPRPAFHQSLDSLDADASSGPDTFERVQSLEELGDLTRICPSNTVASVASPIDAVELMLMSNNEVGDRDRDEDSGILTADAASSLSQTEEQQLISIDEHNHDDQHEQRETLGESDTASTDVVNASDNRDESRIEQRELTDDDEDDREHQVVGRVEEIGQAVQKETGIATTSTSSSTTSTTTTTTSTSTNSTPPSTTTTTTIVSDTTSSSASGVTATAAQCHDKDNSVGNNDNSTSCETTLTIKRTVERSSNLPTLIINHHQNHHHHHHQHQQSSASSRPIVYQSPKVPVRRSPPEVPKKPISVTKSDPPTQIPKSCSLRDLGIFPDDELPESPVQESPSKSTTDSPKLTSKIPTSLSRKNSLTNSNASLATSPTSTLPPSPIPNLIKTTGSPLPRRSANSKLPIPSTSSPSALKILSYKSAPLSSPSLVLAGTIGMLSDSKSSPVVENGEKLAHVVEEPRSLMPVVDANEVIDEDPSESSEQQQQQQQLGGTAIASAALEPVTSSAMAHNNHHRHQAPVALDQSGPEARDTLVGGPVLEESRQAQILVQPVPPRTPPRAPVSMIHQDQGQPLSIMKENRNPNVTIVAVNLGPAPAPPPPQRPTSLLLKKSLSADLLSSPQKQILPLSFSSDEEIVTAGLTPFPIGPAKSVEPPKEKPPPPPTDLSDEDNLPVEPLKRLNSTKRIKKELRTRRSDFLGIEGINDEDLERELCLTKPPDMASILAEERRIEQLHRRSYDTDSNYEQDSSHERDSGVELGHIEDWTKQTVSPDMSQHSRQSSEPFGASVTSSEEDEIAKKEREIIDVLEREEQWRYENNQLDNSDIGEKLAYKLRELEEEKMQMERERANQEAKDLRRQQEELFRMRNEENLRMKQQQHQEEITRNREMMQMNKAQDPAIKKQDQFINGNDRLQDERKVVELHRQQQHESSPARRLESMQEINNKPASPALSSHESECVSRDVLRVEQELLQLEQEELKRQRTNLAYREQKQQKQLEEQWKSLQDVTKVAPRLPARSYRVQSQPPLNYRSSLPNLQMQEVQRRRPPPPPIPPAKPLRLVEQKQREISMRNNRMPSADSIPQMIDAPIRPNVSSTSSPGQQMTRQTLHALSAAPRPRIVQGDQWLQRRKSDIPRTSNDLNYQHWLIQEAELRRISEQSQRAKALRNVQHAQHVTGTSVPYTVSPPKSDSKPLPDSIIQTLTQRVQNRAQEKLPLPPRRRLEHSMSQEHLHSSQSYPVQQHKIHPSLSNISTESQEKMLSVSGKKKCSHCGDELGRGAAMIIESLRLFYHMECFKCCVCHSRLGDGLMGTDVRVRNHKLHCHNCYSSDDGVKFSCV